MKNDNVLKVLSSQFRQSARFLKTIFFLIATAFLTTVHFQAPAAITGKVSGIITAEADERTPRKCHSNNRRNKQHSNDKHCWLLCDDEHPTGGV